MAQFSLSWDAVAGAEGYDVHSGPESGLPIDMQDVGNVTSATVTVTLWSGDGFAQVCGYVTIDGDKVEGPRTDPIPVTASSGGKVVMALR